MSSQLRIIRLALFYGTLLAFLMLTNPSKVAAFVLVVPFGLLFTSLFLTVIEIIRFFRSDQDESVAGLTLRRPRVLASVLAGFPVLLLVLQSIVRLTLWDVFITLAIFLLLYVYVLRSAVKLF